MERLGKCKRIIFPLLLLSLFITYQASITMFAHVHIVNGVMIVHSHPSADQNHTHTVGQVITIAHLSTLQTLEAEGPVDVPVFRSVLYVLEGPAVLSSAFTRNTQCIQLRAPPCWG